MASRPAFVQVHDSDKELASAGPTVEEIEVVVAAIRRICYCSSLETALRVGSVIIHHFYDGDMDAWRTRGPKTVSFRRLAEHPNLPMSPGGLYRCVAIFELCERSNAPSRWRHLGATHLRVVLGLPPETQEKVLAVANANRWSVQQLENEVRQYKSQNRSRGGRRQRSLALRGLQRLQRWIENYSGLLERETIAPEDARRTLQLLEQTRALIQRAAVTSDSPASSDSEDRAPR